MQAESTDARRVWYWIRGEVLLTLSVDSHNDSRLPEEEENKQACTFNCLVNNIPVHNIILEVLVFSPCKSLSGGCL